ncbi:inner membrane protein [Alteribacillus persepolensis]|uniref:Inner membrane protein n=1 Tax=Alteribacillus persepolensis TaxID=568899 RepID=A0A1G7Z1I9_9BACI|nr:metal-dependent hydrolase [Alteribacillus persepolensis]SDH02573.1 inner membrane protein [Alteribacillus persepolensis]
MKAGTHVIGGVAAGAAGYSFISMPFSPDSLYGITFIASGVIGGLLPDICHPFSWIGRRLRLLSRIIHSIFGHRTVTHSFLFIAVLFLSLGMIEQSWGTPIQYGITIGAASHLLLDMLTPRGVALFYPITVNIKAPLTAKTGSIMGEGVINLLMILWIVYYGTHLT